MDTFGCFAFRRGLADADQALNDARELDQAATLMFILAITTATYIFSGYYGTAIKSSDKLIAMAAGKGAALWRAWGTIDRAVALALSGKAAEAVHIISAGMSASRSTGAGYLLSLSFLIGLGLC